jgi:choline kinase
MKALILAAGPGTRIRLVHGDRPTCLIRFNNDSSTILDHQIDNLLSAGISKIGIVVGYEKDQIIDHVRIRHPECLRRFHFIANPRFMETNDIYSLWLAREWIDGDAFVCLNAGVVFHPRVLAGALRSQAPVTAIIDPPLSGTYAGITVFSADAQTRLFSDVETLIRSGRENGPLDSAVQQLADEGVHIEYSGTEGLPWAEIDTPGDLAFARLYVFPKLQPVAAAA